MQELINITTYCLLLSAIFWLIPKGWRGWLLVAGTALFMFYNAPASGIILALSTVGTYWIFRLLPSAGWASMLVIAQALGGFLLFKMGWLQHIASPLDRFMPLGLSYYAFRQIHYGLEYYKGRLPRHDFSDFVAYLFFLPTLLIGPIHRFPQFVRDRFRQRWDPALFSLGLQRILYGFSKALLIGNLLITNYFPQWTAPIADSSLWLATYLHMLEYTLSAYFIFAGFSDVAIGCSYLFGHRVMENFNAPFLADNINEFWNRWHISLSSWVKDYVFVPLSSLTRQPIIGILATMLVIGLWHEISWRYIVWGGFHGLGIAVWHLYKDSELAKKLSGWSGYRYAYIFLTFHFVMLSFTFIREGSWTAVARVWAILFGLN